MTKKYGDYITKDGGFRTLTYRSWHIFLGDSLLRNSFFLMLSTAIMACFGFFFWLISAHSFSTENIGIATTLISTMSTIAVLSLVGFDAAIVRFVPKSKQRNEELNTALVLVGAFSLVLGILFIVFVRSISPKLSFISESPYIAVSFILFCVMCALNILTDAVFLAFRQTKYTLIINTTFSLIKITLPLLFIHWGALGIFTAAALSQTLGFVLSIAVMVWKLDYRPKLTIHVNFLERVWHYCTGSYIAGILTLIPVMVLPIIITNTLGEKQTAYYYIVTMIGSLLYIIPQATTSSLFAEGSHDEQSLSENIKKVVRLVGLTIIPAIALVFLFGREILQIFGKGYSTGGITFLYFVAITGIVASFSYTFASLFRVLYDIKYLIISNFVYACTILGLTYVLLPLGLYGIGISWFSGYLASAVTSYILYANKPKNAHYKMLANPYIPPKSEDLIADLQTIFSSKLRYFYTLAKHGFKTKKILFYPNKPEVFHSIYRLCHILGYEMTNDPKTKVQAIFAFEDTTIRHANPLLDALSKNKNVINYRCGDISKEKVEKTFSDIFGYGTFINPEVSEGSFLRKSNINAVHDGIVINCPDKHQDGYVYQRIINNIHDNLSLDYRVPIFNNKIPYVCLKYKKISNRFGHSEKIEYSEASSIFSEAEIGNIILFCKTIGLDYGELDILRDNDDGRIFIVDANNTPAEPRSGRNLSKKVCSHILTVVSDAFITEFLTPPNK